MSSFPCFRGKTSVVDLQVSATIGAAAVFAVVAGYVNDWWGRKPAVLTASFVFTTGAVLMGVALNREMLLAGRIIVGMGIGEWPERARPIRVLFHHMDAKSSVQKFF